jgi:hypothetical protein
MTRRVEVDYVCRQSSESMIMPCVVASGCLMARSGIGNVASVGSFQSR